MVKIDFANFSYDSYVHSIIMNIFPGIYIQIKLLKIFGFYYDEYQYYMDFSIYSIMGNCYNIYYPEPINLVETETIRI